MKKIAIVSHRQPDADSAVASILLAHIFDTDFFGIRWIFVNCGEEISYEERDRLEKEGYRIFHVDTSKKYDPRNLYFDHHNGSTGRCSALLIYDFYEKHGAFGNLSSFYKKILKTLAWFAQASDRETDKSESAENRPGNIDKINGNSLYVLNSFLSGLKKLNDPNMKKFGLNFLSASDDRDIMYTAFNFCKSFIANALVNNSLTAKMQEVDHFIKTRYGIAFVDEDVNIEPGHIRAFFSASSGAFQLVKVFIIGYKDPKNGKKFVVNILKKSDESVDFKSVEADIKKKFPGIITFVHHANFSLEAKNVEKYPDFTFEEFKKYFI